MFAFLRHHPYRSTPEPDVIGSLGGFGTAGEILSLSFSVFSPEPVETLVLSASALRDRAGTQSFDAVSLSIVTTWEQAGVGVYQSASVRVGELLLKDDRVSLHDGYKPEKYRHWRHLFRRQPIYDPPDIRLEGDVCTSLDGRETKQVWVCVRLPPGIAPGIHCATILVQNLDDDRAFRELELRIEVLPIVLVDPSQDLLLWYKGTLDPRSHQHGVPPAIFQAQLQDIRDHGFRSISLNEYDPRFLQRAVNIARAVGFDRNVLLTAPYTKAFAAVNFGPLHPIYYASDELDMRGDEFVRHHVEIWRAAKAAGKHTMASLVSQSFAKRFLDESDIGCAPDIFSLYLPSNLAYFQARSEFEQLRTHPTYYYWQSHMEKPDLHRVLAGLYLWKSKADGIAPYCYQHLPKAPFSPFNDFDEWEPGFHLGAEGRPFKDHMTTYPARSGSIPTVQWKGLADGIADLRYLLTFKAVAERAEACAAPEDMDRVRDAKTRCEAFLETVSLGAIDILSETNAVPYSTVGSEQYSRFREQLARDIVMLDALVMARATKPRASAY